MEALNPGDTNHILCLMSASFVPTQKFDVDQPIEAETFKDHVKMCEANFKNILSALDSDKSNSCLNKKSLIRALLLCGEHSNSEPWTSSQTINQAELLIKLLLVKCKCANVMDLFLFCKIEMILVELRPKLLKDSWKNNPAAVTCFKWILFHIKCPHLGDVLSCVLPTCLLLIDDHVYSNKTKGLKCLEHIASNVSRAELNQYGQGSVMYSAIEHMIYLREPEIIPSLAACLAALLSKTERSSSADSIVWNHFDDVLNIWLPSMEMEQRLLLREAYIESLDGLLQAMGLSCVRWSKKLLNILTEYCEQEHTRDRAVSTLLTFITVTWPRLSFNFEQITVILMKVVIQISKSKSCDKSREHTLKLVKKCCSSLDSACHEKYNSFMDDLKKCDELKEYVLLMT